MTYMYIGSIASIKIEFFSPILFERIIILTPFRGIKSNSRHMYSKRTPIINGYKYVIDNNNHKPDRLLFSSVIACAVIYNEPATIFYGKYFQNYFYGRTFLMTIKYRSLYVVA